MYHGFDWYGRTLEVREVRPCFFLNTCLLSDLQDRYAGLTGSTGGFRGSSRGAPRGLGRGGFRGGLRGFRGGFSQAGGGRDFSNQELYADYNGPDQSGAPYGGGGGGGGGGYSGGGGGGGNSGFGGGGSYPEGEPSQQIMVRNVSHLDLFALVALLRINSSCLGRPPMKILWSYSKQQAKLNLQKSCLKVPGPRVVALFNSPKRRKLRLLSVQKPFFLKIDHPQLFFFPAKFQGYMYGGRPLGALVF